ncbi:DUF3800 domain-containing protein [Curtobacterium flaccumfaciens]|uniref:DUF3800 domain-containing protein n=1 Tax=Curtobacterium flaccumfaciens TaxID=2035 RepID=UPI003D9AADE8
MRAYVDESEPGGGRDHTAYVLAAVIISVSISDAARADVRAATPRRMRKLHWYEALPSQRISWLDLLQHAVAVIVVRYDGAVARTERRRRRCIERLVHELELRKVGHVILETRGPARDKDDRAMFDALRDRGVGHGVRFEHLNPSEEPLLALADIACGAHVAGLAGDHGLSSPILVS